MKFHLRVRVSDLKETLVLAEQEVGFSQVRLEGTRTSVSRTIHLYVTRVGIVIPVEILFNFPSDLWKNNRVELLLESVGIRLAVGLRTVRPHSQRSNQNAVCDREAGLGRRSRDRRRR